MNFILKPGPFIYGKNTKYNIELTALITLIPFLIYRLLLNPINNSILFGTISLSTIISSLFIDYIKGKKLIFKNYISDIVYILIVSIIIPENISYLFIFLINLIITIIKKFVNIINFTSLIGFLSTLFLIINNKNIVFTNYNLFVMIIVSLISIVVMIINKSFKFRITLSSLLLIIIGCILKNDFGTTSMILLFNSIYVFPNFTSTPNNAFIQILFGLIIGVLSIFLPISYLYILVVIISLIFIYIDRHYTYYLATKKGI